MARRGQGEPTPPATAGQGANGTIVTPPLKSPASHWSLANLLGKSEKKFSDPNPSQSVSRNLNKPGPTSSVVIDDSTDAKKSWPPTPLTVDRHFSDAHSAAAMGTIPTASAMNTLGNLPTATTSNDCSYPCTRFPESTPLPPLPPASVHGAFDGLLSHDVEETAKARAVPLLSPYRDLPVGYIQYGQTVPTVAAEPSRIQRNGNAGPGYPIQQGTLAPAKINKEGRILASDDQRTPTAKTAVAASVPAVQNDRQKVTQTSAVQPTAATSSRQFAAAEPFTLNGVEAHQIQANPLSRPKIVYHPTATVVDNAGHKVIQPNVQVAADSSTNENPTLVQLAQFAAASAGPGAAPVNVAPESAYPIDEQQWMPSVIGEEQGNPCSGCQGGNCRGGCHGGCDGCRNEGIGAEYVAQAQFFIDSTQPFNNCRIRADLRAIWSSPTVPSSSGRRRPVEEVRWIHSTAAKRPSIIKTSTFTLKREPTDSQLQLKSQFARSTRKFEMTRPAWAT